MLTEQQIQERRELISIPCWLNDEPAKITGVKNQFANVSHIDSPLTIEFSWRAVRRIMNRDQKFYS